MSECSACGAQVHAEEGVLVDNSGGDVCGVQGGNEPHQDYSWLSDPAEQAFLLALKPKDVVANAHRWYDWVAQFGGDLGDSVIREAAFTKASQFLGIDYDDLYAAWLDRIPVAALNNSGS